MGLRGAGLTVTSEFAADVQKIVGPVLKGLGFILDGIDDNPDEGGGVSMWSTAGRMIANCRFTILLAKAK